MSESSEGKQHSENFMGCTVWPMLVYEIPLTTVEIMEKMTKTYIVPEEMARRSTMLQ